MNDKHERFLRENALIDALSDDYVDARRRIAAEEARGIHRLASLWELAGEQTARIASADSRRRDLPLRAIAAQVAAEARVDDRRMQTQMHEAWRLVNELPATFGALEAGRISRAHAQAIADAASGLDEPGVRTAYERVVLGWAEAESVGRTRAYARQLAEKLNPRTMQERHADARQGRAITLLDLDDGMSQIIALLPTLEAHGIYDRLTRQAVALEDLNRRKTRVAGEVPDCADARDRDPDTTDDRTRDQKRADLFTDMLLAGSPSVDPTTDGGLGAIRAQVQITLPITTLTGVTQGGAELDGRAPIDPMAARRLAGETRVWDRVMFDPVTAVVTAVDRYEPTPSQRRLLRARDQHCRMPGCRRAARHCQIDHTHERRQGGVTALENLACLCVRHHVLKTETEWTASQLPGGSLRWSSPSGRTYLDAPRPVVFVPDDVGPPPF